MSLEEEVRTLRARVAQLETRLEKHILPLVDRIDENIGAIEALQEVFLMPTLFLLAGDGHRELLRGWLAELAVRRTAETEDPPLDSRTDRRIAYWRTMLDQRPQWKGFEPSGWQEPDWPE